MAWVNLALGISSLFGSAVCENREYGTWNRVLYGFANIQLYIFAIKIIEHYL